MKRDRSIDVAKGIAILLVTFGHSIYINKYLKEWVYTVHMPLFFFISGYLFNYDKYKDNYRLFFKKKFKSLIIPYFLLALFMWIILFIFDFKLKLTASAINKFIGIFIGFRLTKHYFCLWFFLVLFFIENIFYFLVKYFKKYLYFIGTALFIISYFEFKYVHGFFYSIDLIPISLFFLITGYLFKKDFYKWINNFNSIIKIVLSVVSLVISYYFAHINTVHYGFINIYQCNIGNPIFYGISTFTGIGFVYLVSILIKKNSILEDLGKNTMVIYAFQNPIVFPVAYYLVDCLALQNRNVIFIFTILFVLPILRLFAYLIDKYIPIMSGKSK